VEVKKNKNNKRIMKERERRLKELEHMQKLEMISIFK
jgi:hypothetical protein